VRSTRKIGFVVKTALLALGLALALIGCKKAETPAPTEEAAVALEEKAPELTEPQYDAADRLGSKGAPFKGPMDGVVTLIEFSSYQCPFCNRVRPTIKQLMEAFPNDLRVVFMQHPLPMQQQSGPAAEAALEANAQGKFWEFHELLMDNQRALARENLEAYAEKVGLDMERFRRALDEGIHKERVQKDLAIAQTAGIRGTPNFLINGRNLAGAQPFERFEEIVRAEVEATKKLIAEGKSLPEAYAARLEENLKPPAAQPERRTPPQPDPNAKMAVPLGDSPAKGGAEPLVVIVEFSSYQCPFCGRVRATTSQLLEEYGDDVGFVFKQRPLAFQQLSDPAARAALAARRQGKFWEFHNKLFDNQREISTDNFAVWAGELGLDVDKFKADMESDEVKAELQADVALGDRLAAQGTPHFFINGYRLRGAQPLPAFKAIIDRELAKARAAIEAGTPRAEIYAKMQEGAITGPPPMVGGDAAPARPTPPPVPEGPVEINVGDSISFGPADAKVTLVEFSDFKCGFCGRLFSTVVDLKPEYMNRVRFVKKQFPLGRWPESEKAAQASLAAHAQGKHDELVKLIYENQRTFNEEMIFELAEKAGLDMVRFRNEMENGTWAEQVRKDRADGMKAGVRGTPSLFLNGQRVGGALPTDQLRALLDKALAE
jgi:protein-disulfide isomerase